MLSYSLIHRAAVFLFTAVASVLIIVPGQKLQAGSPYTWTSAASGNWSSASNWLGSNAPTGAGNPTDIYTFTEAVGSTAITSTIDTGVINTGAVNLSTINYQGTGNTATFTIAAAAGNSLNFGSAATIMLQSSNSLIVSAPISFAANGTIGDIAGGTLTISGGITAGANGITFLSGSSGSGSITVQTGAITSSSANALTFINQFTKTTTVSSTITLSAATTIAMDGPGTGITNITGGITLGGATSFSNNGPGTLKVAGGITNAGFLTTFTGNGLTNLTTVALAGGGGLTMSGTGTLSSTLTTDSFTGAVTIGNGLLSAAVVLNGATNSSIGASANIAANLTLNNGGILQTTGNAANSTTNRLFTLGAGGGVLDASGTGAATWNNVGSIAFTAGANNSLTLQGGNMNANTFNPLLGDVNSPTFITSLTKAGSGLWVVGNAANTYTGVTTVNGGILSVGTLSIGGNVSSIGQSTNAASNLVINSGTFRYTGSGQTTDRLLTISDGATIDGNGSGLGLIVAGNGVTPAITIVGSPTQFTLTGNSALTVQNQFNAYIGAGGGTLNLVKNGTGFWALGGVNTYTGTTTVVGGVLQFNFSASSIGGSGASIIVNAAGTAALNYAFTQTDFGRFVNTSAGNIALGSTNVSASLDFSAANFANVSLGASGTATYSGTLTPFGTTYRLGGGGGTLTVTNGLSVVADSLVVGGNGAGQGVTGPGTVNTASSAGVVNNAGTVILAGGSAFTGGITIQSGSTLQGNASALTPFGSANSVLITSGNLQLNPDLSPAARNVTIGVLKSFGGTVTIASTSNTTATTLTAASLTNSATVNGNSSGNGAIIFNPGSGTATINSGSIFTFTAAPAVTSGNIVAPWAVGQLTAGSTSGDFLTLSGNNLAGAPAYTVIAAVGGGTANATVFSETGTVTLTANATGNAIKVGGTLALGAKTLTLGDTNASNTAGIILNGGTISGTLASGSILFGSSTGAIYTSSAGGTISGIITGSAGLNLFGPGVLTLSGANTYSGGTFINNAIVRTTAAGATTFGTGGITFNGGGTFVDNGGTLTLNSITLNGGVAIIGNSNGNGQVLSLVNQTVTGTASGLVIGASSNVTFGAFATSGNAFVAPITLNGGGIVTIGDDSQLGNVSNTVTLVGGTDLQDGSTNVTTNRSIILNGGGRLESANGRIFTINGTISGDGGLSLVATGGTYVLTGNNTYTGGTYLGSGNVTFSSDANFGASSGTLTIAGGLTLTSSSANTTLTRAIVLNASTVTFAQGANTLAFSGPISSNGGGGLTFSGTGTVTISGASNTYAGATIVSGAALLSVSTLANGGVASSIGSSSNDASNLVISGNGATFQYTGAAVATDRLFTLAAAATSVDASGSGLLNFTNTGAINYGGIGSITSSQPRTITLTGTGSGSLSPLIANNGDSTLSAVNTLVSLTKTGVSTWTLANANNSYSGVTTITGGVLSTSTLANGGTVSNIGASSTAAANLVLNGGVLQYTGANISIDRSFTLGSTATGSGIDASGTGTLTLSSVANITVTSGTPNLTLTGTNTGLNTLRAALVTANTSLTKTGIGTWALTGTNTYTGATAVNGGTLVVGVSGVGSLGLTAVSVGPGSLGGTGTIGGAVTVNSGGTLFTGNDATATIGTLTVNSSVTLNAGSIQSWKISGVGPNNAFNGTNGSSDGAAGTQDLLNLTGGATSNLTTNGVFKIVETGMVSLTKGTTYSFTVATATGTVTANPTGFDTSSANDFATYVSNGGMLQLLSANNAEYLVLSPTATPEPANVMLICAPGLIGLLLLRSRKRRFQPEQRQQQ